MSAPRVADKTSNDRWFPTWRQMYREYRYVWWFVFALGAVDFIAAIYRWLR